MGMTRPISARNLPPEQKKLFQAGWRSTGDLPYIICRSVNVNGTTLASHFAPIVRDFFREKGDAYKKRHTRMFGRTMYVSPTVIPALTKEIENRRRENKSLKRGRA